MALKQPIRNGKLVAPINRLISLSKKGTSLLDESSRCGATHEVSREGRHTSQFDTPGTDSWKFSVGNGCMTMDAAVLWKTNGIMRLERLYIPQPKRGEVLLKIRACGVCHTDLHVIKAEQPFPTPCVLGHEVTGEVLEHGPNVDPGTLSRVPIGSKVVGAFIMPCGGCYFCNNGKENLCAPFFKYNRGKGTLYDGQTRLFLAPSRNPVAMYSMAGLAEYCVIPATAVTPLPSTVPYAESAIMGCAMFTAYGAMRNAADLRAGQSVAILGTGGVGSSCIQIAKAFGASKVIAVDISDKKLETARKLGASASVNALKENVEERLKSLTGGFGVDIAVEALGRAETFNQAILSLKDGGRAVMVGIAPVGANFSVEMTRLVRRNISILGSYGAKARQDLATIVNMVEAGHVDVASVVSERHNLSSAALAYERLDRGEIVGRAIVDIGI